MYFCSLFVVSLKFINFFWVFVMHDLLVCLWCHLIHDVMLFNILIHGNALFGALAHNVLLHGVVYKWWPIFCLGCYLVRFFCLYLCCYLVTFCGPPSLVHVLFNGVQCSPFSCLIIVHWCSMFSHSLCMLLFNGVMCSPLVCGFLVGRSFLSSNVCVVTWWCPPPPLF